MKKDVKVHKCYSIEFGEPRPIGCKCRWTVSVKEAEDMVKKGTADWVVGYDRPKPYQDGGQICLTGRMLRTPRGATIEKAHIERAYLFGGNDEEKARIEIYGLMTLLARVSVGKNYERLKSEPIDGREKDWGRAILFFGDDRSQVYGPVFA